MQILIALFIFIQFSVFLNGDDHPNFLIILADDCTYNDLPLYGGKNAKTPNIDKLATEGLTFNQAYVSSSMCQPCRAELYSGLYPMGNGCAWNHSGCRPDIQGMPQMLEKLGYRVGLAGKIHIRPSTVFPFEKVEGFDTHCVRGNQIIERRFESYGAPHPDGRPIDKNRWTERGDFIGSNPKGHPPRTIDDLYKEAKTLTGRPIPKFHRGVIRVNKEGLLLSCFIQDNRIADDAPIKGINITSISLGSEKSPNEKQLKPTFEQWVASGKKLPEGMMFIGGSPWFNETTGKKREPIEVYEMIYGKKEKPAPAKPIRPLFNPNKRKPFPQHWGDPPKRQTRDLRPLPGGYGMGSGTLANWIQKNLDRDKDRSNQPD